MKKGFFNNKKAVGLTISFVVHAALLYGLFHARITVRIFDFPSSRVQNVVIVPPVRLRLPAPSESPPIGRGAEVPGRTDDYGRKSDRKEKSGEVSGESRDQAGPGGGTDSGLVPGNLLKGTPGTETSGEKEPSLALGAQNGEEGDGKLLINLAKIPDVLEDTLFERPRRPSGRFPAIKNPGSRFAGRGGGTGGSGAGSGPGGGGQRASAQFESPGYNIAPWAQKAMSTIQFNWKIPYAQTLLDKNEVRIAVTIEKDGTFSAFDVITQTEIEIFNLAAVNALKLSAPLPSLPDDFPAQNLKAFFVFAYHD